MAVAMAHGDGKIGSLGAFYELRFKENGGGVRGVFIDARRSDIVV